ncbi:hypothetical protein [Nocardia vulneris]|uniref:Uncharacterized protein n=1 Tax=Nocardia vulneris TaxID=1141657 RepID=A0ABR4Z8F8_9NOCA|nr:hypothetical protein [Nocardia vulneris]KIA61424.1 hypothetical protein FG87_30905 [Nocardia vulneris]
MHLNLGSVAAGVFDDPTPAESANLEAEKEMQRTGRGYSAIQATRPQTLGYFAALEQPESLVEQVRGFFRLFRA